MIWNHATTMKDTKKREEGAAKTLIEACGLSMMEAAQVVLELKHSIAPESALDAADCIRRLRYASGAMREEMVQVSLEEAVRQLLESKAHRREATQRELRYYTQKILRHNSEQAGEPLRALSVDVCREMLQSTFPNGHSRRKARTILHGLFAFCRRMGWLEKNPVESLLEPPLPEREIRPLGLAEILRLLQTALLPDHQPCAAAAGLMLWGGIRPAEVARLHWRHIHYSTRTITLHSLHAKTGGARCISMQPVLVHWLRRYAAPGYGEDAPVCPQGWLRRWGQLHRASGLHPWVPDILRHSFASYHAAHFQNLEQLRCEMGHHSLNMLRFRYMATGYISPRHAACFWRSSYWDARLNAPCKKRRKH